MNSGCALYWIHDEPLLTYLGVSPARAKFDPTLFTRARLLETVEEIRHAPGMAHVNRLGVLLGNAATERTTKTLAPGPRERAPPGGASLSLHLSRVLRDHHPSGNA